MNSVHVREIAGPRVDLTYIVKPLEEGAFRYTRSLKGDPVVHMVNVLERTCTCDSMKYGPRPCKHLQDALLLHMELLSGITIKTYWDQWDRHHTPQVDEIVRSQS